MLTKPFIGLWSKYRPAILKMMVDADAQPQTYQLSQHEFHAFNNQKRAAFSFAIEVSKGKIIGGLKDSLVAQDLWEMLKTSPKGNELVSSSSFNISMNNQFILRVEKSNHHQVQ